MITIIVILLVLVGLFFLFRMLMNWGSYPHNVFLPLPPIGGKKPLDEEEIEKLITLDIHEVREKNPEILKNKYDVICIGSGISGMISSALLSRAGKTVLILEQHDRHGGYTHEFTENGREGVEYNFCPGIHYLGKLNTTMVLPLTVVSDGQLKTRTFTGEELYEHGDEKFEVKEPGYLKLREILIERFPEEEQAIRRYYKKMNIVVGHGMNFVVRKLSPWHWKPFLYLFKPVSEWTKYSNIPVSDVMDECGMKNEALRQFLYVTPLAYYNPTFSDKVDFASLAMVFMGITHKNIPYISYKSGGGAFARAILPNLRDGSHAVCGVRVKRIQFDRNHKACGVLLHNDDNERDLIECDTVISCAGFQNTYNILPKKIKRLEEVSHIPKYIQKYPYTGFFFIIFLGLDASPEELGMEHGLMVMTGNKKMEIYDDIRKVDPEEDFDGLEDCYVMALSNDVEIEFSEKYPNHSKVQVIAFMNEKWVEKFENTKLNQRGNEYEELKRKLETKYLDILFKRFPKMEEHVDYVDSGTTLTAKHYVDTPKGSGYGMVMTASKWMMMNEKHMVNPVDGLYFCGADILCGVAGGVYTSLNLVGSILKRNIYLDVQEARKIQKRMMMKKKKL